jgi:hypothetical protein
VASPANGACEIRPKSWRIQTAISAAWPSYVLNSIRPGRSLIASAQSRTAGISITIMPAAGSRAYTREHAANWQLGKPAQRFCNSQVARGLPSVLLNVVVLGHQPPYQADRPRRARDIRGRIGLALDCRSGPGPRTARCRARSSSGLQDSTVVDFGSRQSALKMVIVKR